jgi:RimJ/RimL family protein N-acetyltransferase
MPDPLPLLDRPRLRGERVLLREPREADIDDRLRYPIDPEEEDAYGSAWRREWDGRRYHTREHLAASASQADEPGMYAWVVDYGGRCVGSARLRVDANQHSADYAVGLFVPGMRGQGLGREITRLVLSWGFGELRLHRVELQVLAGNDRAIRCYLACGFCQEGVLREAELYPGGWKDLIVMSVLRPEYAGPETARAAG